MIAIPISQDISRLFREIKIDADRDPSDHITMFYLGDDVKPNVLFKIIPIIFELSSEMRPFSVSSSKITSFPKGEDGYPVIAEIKSNDLLEFRKKLAKALDKNKIEYAKNFKEYKPHITLGYADDKPEDIKIPEKVNIQINQVSLYGGNRADAKLFVNFPFSLGIKEKSASILALADSFNTSVRT